MTDRAWGVISYLRSGWGAVGSDGNNECGAAVSGSAGDTDGFNKRTPTHGGGAGGAGVGQEAGQDGVWRAAGLVPSSPEFSDDDDGTDGTDNGCRMAVGGSIIITS